MKHVTALIGTARRKHTHDAVATFLRHLEAFGDVTSEVVMLSDYHIESCCGCKLCFEKGEDACPYKDDRDALVEKMTASDGIVLATPSYMFQVSGTMKTLIDRLSYIAHRPRFFGKSFTNIVTQGLPMESKIGKYLNLVGSCWGYSPVPGTRITALEPMTDGEVAKADAALLRHSQRFHHSLFQVRNPVPSMVMLMGFRIGRTTMKWELDERSCDYLYFKERGWFDAAYYYPTRLGPVKRLVGSLTDGITARMAKKRGQLVKKQKPRS